MPLSHRFDALMARKDITRREYGGSTRALGKMAYVSGQDKGFHHIINAPAQAKKQAGIAHYGSTEWRHNHQEWREPIRKAPLP